MTSTEMLLPAASRRTGPGTCPLYALVLTRCPGATSRSISTICNVISAGVVGESDGEPFGGSARSRCACTEVTEIRPLLRARSSLRVMARLVDTHQGCTRDIVVQVPRSFMLEGSRIVNLNLESGTVCIQLLTVA